MKPDEISAIIEAAISGKFNLMWLYILASVILGFASAFLFEYFKTKGQNLATKSDIEELTKKVEEIKFEYFKKAETLKGVQDIRNPKRKELYEKVEKLRSFFIETKNNPNFHDLSSIYTKTKELLIYLASNDAFKDMQPEVSIIEKDYNLWVDIANHTKTGYGEINTSNTVSALELIQNKILGQ